MGKITGKITGRLTGKILGVIGVLVLALAASSPAEAGSRFFFGFGFPLFGWGWPYYSPYYYAPAPVYYAPPPVYYAPRPVYYSGYDPFFDRPVYTPPAARTAPRVNCRRFSGDGIDDDTGQAFYGVACLQADGKWHIVERN